MKIAIIGGGWYGAHIALTLQKEGHFVTLFESGDDIFKGISGTFGIRLHAGPHYPRSEKTRKNCQEGFSEFIKEYPELVVEHVYSLYGLGNIDATGKPSKIDLEKFRAVGKENQDSREIDTEEWGFTNLLSAFDIKEPSILVGNLLREKFKEYLKKAGVTVLLNSSVEELKKVSDKIVVRGNTFSGIFDHVVNTTSFKALLPPPELPLPFDLNIVYQPCLALVYEDRLSKTMSQPPFSFIVMDGWYPCIMPWIEDNEKTENFRKYVVTHGSYTIMDSFSNVEEANDCLATIDENFVEKHIRPKCEFEMNRFWPEFFDCLPNSTEPRFKYIGYKGSVLAKAKSNGEFRSSIIFEVNGMIYIFPGKVSNIFDAARETLSLINNTNILKHGDYRYVQGGSLHEGIAEFSEAITVRNTCDLHTYRGFVSDETRSTRTSSSDTMSILSDPTSPVEFEKNDLDQLLVSDTCDAPERKNISSDYGIAQLTGKYGFMPPRDETKIQETCDPLPLATLAQLAKR